MSNILVIGSINMDLTILGVPKIPQYGESLTCNSYEYSSGGKGANQAVACAKLGATTNMIGCIGTDTNGEKVIKSLNKENVDTTLVKSISKESTGFATMCVDQNTGKYVCYLVYGANNFIGIEQVEIALKENHYDMILIQLEMPLQIVSETISIANRYNTPVFLDAGPAMSINLKKLKNVFIISPNEVETEALIGIYPDTEEKILLAAEKLFKIVNPQFVILKLGERGSFLYDGKKGKLFSALKVRALDSTAAGDTFGAAFAVKYCETKNIEVSMKYANCAAAICVSRKGAQNSMPTKSEVEKMSKIIV